MNRKAAVVILVVFGLWMQTAQGIMYIEWGHSGAFYRSDGTTFLLDGPGVQKALAQLIWAGPDNVPEDPLPGEPVRGDDMLVDWTILNTDDHGVYGAFNAGPISGATLLGYVYMRVYDQGSDSGVVGGMWYYEGPLFLLQDLVWGEPPPTPQTYDIYLETGELYVTLNKQVIPEPATWALMLVGGAALARKKLRRE